MCRSIITSCVCGNSLLRATLFLGCVWAHVNKLFPAPAVAGTVWEPGSIMLCCATSLLPVAASPTTSTPSVGTLLRNVPLARRSVSYYRASQMAAPLAARSASGPLGSPGRWSSAQAQTQRGRVLSPKAAYSSNALLLLTSRHRQSRSKTSCASLQTTLHLQATWSCVRPARMTSSLPGTLFARANGC